MAERDFIGRQEPGGDKLCVLLIEDSAEDAELIVRRLQKGGYRVEFERVDTAPSASAAIARNRWDLIICDYTLPHFSGHDALTIWRDKKCAAPFIFISGTLGEQDAVEALKQGASDYLLKDNLTRLIPAVDRALREVRDRVEREQERVRGEQSLRTSEARFRALIENSSDGILVLNTKGEPLFSSPSVQRILGYQPSESLGNFLELTHSEDRHEALLGLQHCTSEQAVSYRLRLCHKSGGWRVIDCVYSNLLNEPAVGGIVINFRDVTEASLADEALTKSEEKFSKAFRSSPLAVTISTKHEGRYLDANEAFLRMLGYSRSEIIGRSSVQLGVWAKPEERRTLMRHLDNQGRVTGLRATFKTKTGDIRETEIAAEPIDLGGISCVLAITQDVTETRRLEAQFRQAQKMEAVGQLAGGVAHDFNNLLMVMRSYAQMIEFEGPTPKILEYTNRIVEAADKAASVTRQLLAFSRRQPQELKKVDLNRVVPEFCAMLPGLIGEDIQLQISTKAESGTVFADQGQLEQVIMNLAVNSRDAMPGGGKLTIETSDIELGENMSEHHGARIPPGSYVLLTVTDSGHGMSEETKARIFEPFFTTKEVGRGTGLGLATVYGIVKQHRGFIWAYSEVGVGTSFKVYLPRWRGAEQTETRTPGSTANIRPSGGETILIVEDQPALLEVIGEYLASMGYKILKASDGESALDAANTHGGPIQVLLTDVVMPGMRGSELATRLAKVQPGVRTIFMSGYSETNLDSVESAIVVHKPIDLGLLVQKIRQVLADAG